TSEPVASVSEVTVRAPRGWGKAPLVLAAGRGAAGGDPASVAESGRAAAGGAAEAAGRGGAGLNAATAAVESAPRRATRWYAPSAGMGRKARNAPFGATGTGT